MQILCDDETQRKKLLMPFYRRKTRDEVKVCLDLNAQKWEELYKVCDRYKQMIRRNTRALSQNPNHVWSQADQDFAIEFECLKQILDLFAETCLEKNKEN